jgi:hypothetical protein
MLLLPPEVFQRIFPVGERTQFRERRRHAQQERYPRVLILAVSRNIGVAIVELIELDGAE